MFVDIDEPKSPSKVEIMLFPFKKGREKITPEVCFDVLKSTNYQRNIKDMLNCVLALPVDEQAQFQDVVLATFDNREQPNEVILLGKKLATSGEYEEDLNHYIGRIYKRDWIASKAIPEKWKMMSVDEFLENNEQEGRVWLIDSSVELLGFDFSRIQGLKFQTGSEVELRYVVGDTQPLPSDLEVSMCSKVAFSWCDLSAVKKLNFCDGADVTLWACNNLPADFDVSKCSKVDLTHSDLRGIKELKFRDGAEFYFENTEAPELPAGLDVSNCAEVYLGFSDLGSVGNLKFRDGAEVRLSDVHNLPEDSDFSMCSKVELWYKDLSQIENLKFRDGAEVELQYVEKFPHNFDVSNCSKVEFFKCNLTSVKGLKFGDGAHVEFSEIRIPADLDVSMCSKVWLSGCDLSSVEKLKFGAGAKVSLAEAKNLPADLDFSMCSQLDLSESDLSNVEHIVFKNREQMGESKADFPYNWKGQVILMDEENKNECANNHENSKGYLNKIGTFAKGSR